MTNDSLQTFVIHFAGEDLERISHWQSTLTLPHQFQIANTWQLLYDQLQEQSPDLLILDYSILQSNCTDQLDAIVQCCPAVKILLMESEHLKQIDPIEGVKRGVRGYCDRNASDALFRKVVESILMRGEVWVERSLIPRLIDHLSTAPQITPDPVHADREKLLASLSSRELEVANRVCQGESNKRIADVLKITERTVKAHLSAIFKKLNITSRLHLAIFFKH